MLEESLEHFCIAMSESGTEDCRPGALACKGNLATALLYCGQGERALKMNIECTAELLALRPDEGGPRLASCYFNTGVCAVRLGKTDQAVDALQRCIETLEPYCIPDGVPQLVQQASKAADLLAKAGALKQSASIIGRAGQACLRASPATFPDWALRAANCFGQQMQTLAKAGDLDGAT